MKVNFDVSKPCPGYYLYDGRIIPHPKSPNTKLPEGAVEVCTVNGVDWHPLDWWWERINPAIRDTVNTTEAISMQDQINLCLVAAVVDKVPLLVKED